MKSEHDWCMGVDGHNNIAALLRHMRETDGLSVDTCIEIVERPWRWTPEYEQMLKAGAREVDQRGCRDCGHIHSSEPCSCGCRVTQVCLAP